MSPQPSPLEDIAALIRAGAESGDPAAVRAAEALDAWRRSRTIPLEEALGYAPGLRAAEYQRTRDRALAALARGFLGLSGRALERRVREVVEDYAPRFEEDYAAGRRPDDADGGLAFDILASGGLPCLSHLRTLLTELADQAARIGHPRPTIFRIVEHEEL
jgi:hypothetical protein